MCNTPPSQLNCDDVEINNAVLCDVTDLNGYCTTLPDFWNPTGPSPLCPQNGGGSAQNTIWFGFIAGTSTMSLEVIPANCTLVGGQSGIQTGIYQAPCPENGTSIVCQGNCSNSPIILTSSGFTPGNLYYFWIDGCSGSVCDVTVDVLQGGPLMMGTIGPISGPTKVCTGGTFTYSVDQVNGADYYYWTLDGTLVDDPTVVNEVVQVTFLDAGVHQLCLDVANFCLDVGQPPAQKCIDITVSDIVPVNPAPVHICPDAEYLYAGNSYSVGQYQVDLTTSVGCDSTVTLTVDPIIIVPIDPPVAKVCPDDKFMYAGDFYDVGQHLVNLTSYQGCDSVVNLTVDPIIIPYVDLGIIYKCSGDCITIEDNNGNGGIYCQNAESEQVVIDSWQGCDSTVSYTLRILKIDVILDPPYVLGCLVDQTPLSGSASIIENADQTLYKWQVYNGGILDGPDDEVETYTQTAGKYCLNITTISPNGVMCHDSACVNVTVDSNAPTSSITGDTLSCFKDSVLLVGMTNDPKSKFDWTGPNNNKYSTGTIKVANPGLYTLVVTAPNLCSSTSKYTLVSLKGGPNISANGDTIDCNNPSTVLIGNSITPLVTYKWFNQNNIQISNTNSTNASIPGNYLFQVYNTKTGCDTTKTVFLTGDFLKPQNVTAEGDTFSCLIKTVNVKANSSTVGVTYNWQGPSGFTSNIQNPVAPNAGDYTLIVTGNNGCKDTAIAKITADTLTPSLAMINDTIDCFSYTATVSASSNSANPSFNWSGPSGTSTNPAFIVSKSGQYLVTVTDGKNGCTKSAYANAFDDPNKPKALAQVLNPLTCDSLQVALIGSSTINLPSISYKWSGPSGFTDNLKNTKASVKGDYLLVVDNTANGCADTTKVTVLENINKPDISALGDTTDCISGKANLKGFSNTPNAKFEWFDAGGISQAKTANATVVGTGTYTLVVTDPVNGCTSQTNVLSVKDDNTPDISLTKSNDLNCLITSVDLVASSMVNGLNYKWTGNGVPGTSIPNISTIIPGTFTIKVTNPTNGCINSASIVVNQDIKKPVISAITDTIKCNNNKTAHIDGTSDVLNNTTISWSAGASQISTNLDFTTSISQTYTLIVTNNINGCTETLDLFVPENIKIPNISASGDIINCYKPIVTAKGNSTTPNVSYLWTGPSSSGYSAVTKDAVGITTKGNYTFIVTDNVNGCSDSQVVLIDENINKPDLTASGGTLNCINNSQINLTSNSTINGVNYKWSGPNFNSIQQNPVVTNPGSYTVTVTDPVNGCTIETTVSVISDEETPTLNVNNATLDCINKIQTLTANSTTAGVSYLWTLPDGTTNTNSTIDVTIPGDYTIVVTAANGCKNTKIAKVDLNAVFPTAIATVTGELNCTVKSVPVNTNGSSVGTNYLYTWSGPGTIPAQSTQFAAIVPGIYTLTISDTNNGCTKETSVTVPINTDVPTGMVTDQKGPNCFGGFDGFINIPIITGGTAPYLYSINGKPFSSQNQFTFLKEGTFKISVQDAVGCEYDTLITLVQPKKLVINAGKDSIIKWGTPITLYPDTSNAANIKTISWSPVLDSNCVNCLNPTVTLFDAQLFTLTVKDYNGCSSSDKVLILVKKDRPVYIPNTFSPNGDGINDHLGIFTGDGVEEITYFQIYDRWGSKIFDQNKFEPNQQSNGWDGTFRGKKLNSGVFVYWAMVKFKDGESILYKGDVTLQR